MVRRTVQTLSSITNLFMDGIDGGGATSGWWSTTREVTR